MRASKEKEDILSGALRYGKRKTPSIFLDYTSAEKKKSAQNPSQNCQKEKEKGGKVGVVVVAPLQAGMLCNCPEYTLPSIEPF